MQDELASLQKFYDIIIEFLVQYSFQIIGAIIILIVGIKIAGWLAGITSKLCEKKSFDVTLTKFVSSVVKALVMIFVIIITIGKFGISIAPLIAAISAVAFGASFAIQGPLSNYGAGLSIIISRPFLVGNTITVNNVSGVVEDIRLAATILTTEDGEIITIPNKHIVGEIIQNSFTNRIIETSVGIAYSEDPPATIQIIRDVLLNTENVCQEPPPQIGIDQFADSSINLGLRYWVPTNIYHQTRFQVNDAIHAALKENNISIPFPQREIRILEKS